MLKKTILSAGLIAAAGISSNSLPAQASFNLGAAANYAILYEGTGGHNLSISNDTVNGNVGVGGTGHVQFSGPGTINGELDFSASNSGQYSNSNGSNVGPTSVNYNVTAVTNALSAINTLSTDVSGGTNITFTNSGETVNESTGALETIDGTVSRVFNVTAYSAANASVLNIVGDGSGDAVVFNFASGAGDFGNNNVNLGGSVNLSGTGLISTDQILFNFQSTNKNISLTNNGETFQGIILAPNDVLSADNTNLDGRFFGGDSQDMHFVSGANITVPSAPISTPIPATLPLLGGGLLGLGLLALRQRRRANR